MNKSLNNTILLDILSFEQVARNGLSFAFPDKKWWIHKHTTRLTLDDITDPMSLLPVVAYMASEVWTFLGPMTGTVFKARYFSDERSQYGYGLSTIEVSSVNIANMAVVAAICLFDLPAANFDPIVEAFIRIRQQTTGAV